MLMKLLLTLPCANNWSIHKILNSNINEHFPDYSIEAAQPLGDILKWAAGKYWLGSVKREQGEENPPTCQWESGRTCQLKLKWLKTIAQVMKEKYPFVNFTFNLIFKGKVQAQLQTGTKKVYSHLPENRLKLQTFLDATSLKIKFLNFI